MKVDILKLLLNAVNLLDNEDGGGTREKTEKEKKAGNRGKEREWGRDDETVEGSL